MEPAARPRVVVMGVSGAGKTRVGTELAARLGLEYRDGDAFHPAENVAKMARGTPLDDTDRAPWLDAIAHFFAARRELGAVVSCSALRRSYRDRLRATASDLYFLHLEADAELVRARVTSRRDHFMPPSLIDSQLAILEPLLPDERGLTVDARLTPAVIIREFLARV